MKRIGDKLDTRSQGTVKVVKIESMSHLGSKFFGRFRFTVENAAGERFAAYGKNLTYNNKLFPAK